MRCIVIGWMTAGIMGSNSLYDAPVSPICSQMLGKNPNTEKASTQYWEEIVRTE
jgi:CTP:phosphocholine cytidylyltransferase-like protein